MVRTSSRKSSIESLWLLLSFEQIIVMNVEKSVDTQ